MATNMIMAEGSNIELAIAGRTSGYPVIKGHLTGVATTDTDSAGNVSVRTKGVFDLSVSGTNDAGNSAVVVGDALYIAADYTLSKKQSGTFFGYALETVNAGATSTINVLLGTGVIQADGNQLVTDESFDSNPVTALLAGGAAGGTTGNVNIMSFGANNFEYHIKGTQTITAPVIAAGGLDVGMDQTADDGVEITRGITARSPEYFTVGTSPAFYAKLKITITDVSGTDDCAFGFRKAEAYQAAIDNYDEMAALNVIKGAINIETILNNAATSTTDTTDTFADAGTHTLEVYVSAAGVVTFKIDGAAPSATAAFTFANAEKVIPFFYFLHDTDVAGSVLLSQWEVGYQ